MYTYLYLNIKHMLLFLDEGGLLRFVGGVLQSLYTTLHCTALHCTTQHNTNTCYTRLIYYTIL